MIMFSAVFASLALIASSGYWESWNKYSAQYDYGHSTTYVNLRSRVTISESPLIYSFDARIKEEGAVLNYKYKILVNCSSGATMYLNGDSSNKWVKATNEKFVPLVNDACR